MQLDGGDPDPSQAGLPDLPVGQQPPFAVAHTAPGDTTAAP